MNKIEQCTTIDELKAYSMQDLTSLYSKIVKAHCPKFSDKTAAAKRILPLLEQKRREANPVAVPELNEIFVSAHPLPDGGAIIKIKRKRGRPAHQLDKRIYFFNWERFYDRERDFAPQAKQILRALAGKNIDQISEAELIPLISVKTKQDPWRIFQYYRSKMIGRGVLRIENVKESNEA